MFLRRQRVFIGEYDGQAVYYDQKTKEALAADKSALLDTEGARMTNVYIPALVILLFAFGSSVVGILNIGVYSQLSVSLIVLLWLLECIVFTVILEIALYKNVRRAKPTNRKTFRSAMYGNLMLDKKYKSEKRRQLFYHFARIFVVGTCIYSLYLLKAYTEQFGQPIQINIETMGKGVIWFAAILLYNQNNPIRFMNIIKKYKERKIIFAKEEG